MPGHIPLDITAGDEEETFVLPISTIIAFMKEMAAALLTHRQ
jgi:hypothetical protein